MTLFILTLYRLGYIFPQFLFPIKRKKLSFGDHNRLMMDFLTDGTIYFFFIFGRWYIEHDFVMEM